MRKVYRGLITFGKAVCSDPFAMPQTADPTVTRPSMSKPLSSLKREL